MTGYPLPSSYLMRQFAIDTAPLATQIRHFTINYGCVYIDLADPTKRRPHHVLTVRDPVWKSLKSVTISDPDRAFLTLVALLTNIQVGELTQSYWPKLEKLRPSDEFLIAHIHGVTSMNTAGDHFIVTRSLCPSEPLSSAPLPVRHGH